MGALGLATRSATEFAFGLAPALQSVSEFLDVDEHVQLVVGPVRRYRDTASIDITWAADETKRLLPSVDGRLEIDPIVPEGHGALTELVLQGEYSPPARRRQPASEFFLECRVVNATLHHFLAAVASHLESEAPSLSGFTTAHS